MIEKRKRFGATVSCLVFGMVLLVGCSKNAQEKIEMDVVQAMQEELKAQEIQREKQELTVFQSTIPEGYRKVLDDIQSYMYAYYLENGGANEGLAIGPDSQLTYEWESGVDELCLGSQTIDRALFHNGYMFYDIDGNGVDELIISGDYVYSKNGVSAMYTLVDGKAVFLLEGWSRSRWMISEDGTIYYEGSSSAADNYFGLYRLAESGAKLETVDFYFSGGWEDMNWYHNTTGVIGDKQNSEIVEGNFDELLEKFDKQSYIPLELTYFIEYENDGSPEKILSFVEERSRNLDEQLQIETLTRDDKIELTEQRYKLWDDELNYVWNYLKEQLDEEEMQVLREEELAWIADKEETLEAIGSDSDTHIIKQNERGMEMTRDRVYELYQYLK